MKKVTLLTLLLTLTVIVAGCSYGTAPEEDPVKQVTLDLSIDGGGSVISLSEGENRFDKNARVDLTARSDAGWSFDRWIGDVRNSRRSETSILMDEDKKVTVVFKRDYEEPDEEVYFTYERVGHREYKFTASEPEGSYYFEWKFQNLNYWRGKVDDNEIVHEFDSTGTTNVKLEIYDRDESQVGETYEKTINVE